MRVRAMTRMGTSERPAAHSYRKKNARHAKRRAKGEMAMSLYPGRPQRRNSSARPGTTAAGWAGGLREPSRPSAAGESPVSRRVHHAGQVRYTLGQSVHVAPVFRFKTRRLPLAYSTSLTPSEVVNARRPRGES